MREFAAEQLSPDQTFSRADAIRWFATRYPKIAKGTVSMHVDVMSINAARKHHPSVKPGSGHDLFFKLDRDRYRLWQSDTDPSPAYGEEGEPFRSDDEGADESTGPEEPGANGEFAFERDLRNYLVRNLTALESGLTLYEEEGIDGVEYPAGGRYIDILAVDKNGGFVVVELKVSRGYDRTLGQIMRYMAWVKANLAGEKSVRGIIVAGEISSDLELAASLMQGIELVEYQISFGLRKV